jgi:hypothetical protein
MKKFVVTAGLICLPLAVFARQGGMAAIGLTEAGLQSQIERAARHQGDDLILPSIGAARLAAAMALSEAQQVTLMKELAGAARTIVMSPAFQSAYDAYIAKEFEAVDHGIKVKSGEQMMQQIGTKAGNAEFELKMKRDMAAVYVQMAMQLKIEDLKMMFDGSLAEWTETANKAKGSDRVKYTSLVSKAQAIKGLSTTDPDKFRRGYAVLRSAEADGLDTEEALFGAEASSKNENEQLMWDKHNLRARLKRVLAQIVAEAPTVDYAAKTVEKNRTDVFVNPAYEKKSVTWKAMYRAGKGPSAAGVEIARAWLKEL